MSDSVVKRFAESGDAGWALESPQVTPLSIVLTELDEHPDVILVAETAQDFFLLNKNFIDIKIKGGV